jgi:hypothetical protein
VFKCLSHLSYEFSPEIAYVFITLYGIRPLEEAIQHLLVSALVRCWKPRIRGAVGVDIVKADTALRVGYAAAGGFEGWLGASSIFICLTLAVSYSRWIKQKAKTYLQRGLDLRALLS